VVFFDMSVGSTGSTFAATHPQRVRSLILTNLRPSFPFLRALAPEQRRRRALASIGTAGLDHDNPRVAHDPALRRWWYRAQRLLCTPEAALNQLELAARIDIESVLPSIRVPTLVLHRRDNPTWDIETSRATAARIPGARFVELPGSESDLFLGDTAPALAEIERFLRAPDQVVPDRVLATILFTDIVSSTQQLAARGDDAWRHTLDEHDRTTERIVAEYRGRVVKHTGDGILAIFDGPARAVRCAAALRDAAQPQRLALRAGLHTGEIELRPADVTGIAVHAASRISTLARPNEILVSRTVVELTAGSGLEFEPRGEHQLKGVPGTWPTFAAQTNT
jgi:class 3 adenylate cyclase